MCILALLTVISIVPRSYPTSLPAAFPKLLKSTPAPIDTFVETLDVERPYSEQRTVYYGNRGCFASFENRSMCLPPPLVQPSIVHSHHAPSRNSQDILVVRVITTVGARVVCAESKSPGMRAPQTRVANKPRHIRPQTRVDAVKRGTSKRRRPPATIYQRDQDCRGLVEQIRRRASYLVRQKHDGSKDGWERQNQGWFTGDGMMRIGRGDLQKKRERLSCKGVMIIPLAGSAQRHGDDAVGHESGHADHDRRAPERGATHASKLLGRMNEVAA